MSSRLQELRRIQSGKALRAGVGLNAVLLFPFAVFATSVALRGDVGGERLIGFVLSVAVGVASMANMTVLLLDPRVRFFRAIQGTAISMNLILAVVHVILMYTKPHIFPFGHIPFSYVGGYVPQFVLLTLSAIALYFRRPLGWP